MKTEPEYQGQHRISKVYLKQFGYLKENRWMLSVYEEGNKKTSNVYIDDFTKEVNVFDLPFTHPALKRYFENTSNKIESFYPIVISNLKNQKKLTAKDKDVLNHFVANILCRTDPFRSLVFNLAKHHDTREKFISEITMFADNSLEIKNFLDLFKLEYQPNIAIGTLMNHLVHIFRCFNKVIIRDSDNKGWLTTDCPVYFDRQNHYEWIMPVEAEIYMPLSREFCLYMFHPKSHNNLNPLRNLKLDRINIIDRQTFEEITNKIVFNYNRYLIFNKEIVVTSVTE